MRNLKRALSLALASVMVVSMMVVGAGAVSIDDFSDKDEIVNQEAVQMLVELGVINGKDTGDFDPTGIVTRAEMAKMICVVLNGGKDPSLGATVTNTYTDTVNHWASGYIEYCTQLGIVAGDGTGKFNPDATVTGSEAAKMLLVALGYKSEVEGFTGANWSIAVNVRANQKELYSDLSISVDEGLTRDDAAQMIYNALDAGVVTYDYTLISDGSSISSSPTLIDDNDKTLLEDKFNAVKVEGVVVANEYADLNGTGCMDEGKTSIRVTNYDDQGTYGNEDEDKNETFSVSTGMEQLGRSVVVYVKKDSSASKADVLGSVILSDDNTVVTDYSDDTIAEVADDNRLDLVTSGDEQTLVAYNYGSADDLTADLSASSKLGDGAVNTGIEKILIDNNDDGDVDYVLLNTYAFGYVSSYVTSGNGSITVRAGTSGTFSESDSDDVVGFEDVAKGDFVLAAEIGGRLYVEVAETVTGELEAYKESSGVVTKITVDGTDYAVSAIPGYTGGDSDIKDASDPDNISLDSDATFYLGKGGYITAIGEAEESAYNYALVMATGTSTLEDRVRVALSDGTTATYDLNDNSDDPEVGVVYTYTINSSNEIRLTAIDSSNYDALTGDASFTKGRTTVKGTGETYYATASTAFFYISEDDILDANGHVTTLDKAVKIDDVSIYTGYNSAPTLDDGVTGYVYTRGSSTTRATAVVFTGDSLTTADVDDTLYVYSRGTSTSDYTNASVFIAGSDELQSIKVDGSVTAGEVYTYTINSDGYYELSQKRFDKDSNYNGSLSIDGDTYDVISANSDTFVLDGVNDDFVITSDTLFVDDSEYLDDAVAELGAGPAEDDVVTHVVYNNDDDREVIMVVISNQEETDESGYTDKPTVTLTSSDSNLSSDYATWTNAAKGATLSLDVDAANNNQTITVSVKKDSAATGTTNDYTSIGNSQTIYTAGASENGGKVTVTITASETGKVSRTVTYTITVNGVVASAPTVKLTDISGKGTLTGDGQLTIGDNEASVADLETGKTVKFDVSVSASKVESITLNGKTYNSGDAVEVEDGDNTYTLAITVSETDKITTTYTYVVKITAEQADATAPSSVELAAGSTNQATVTDTTVTLNKGEDVDNAVTLTDFSASANTVKITVTGGNNTITLKNNDTGITTTYTSGADVAIADSGNGTASYTLTIISTETGKAPVTSIYNITFTLET